MKSISRAFRLARERTCIEWSGSPPSFHEIRSLSGRLHEAAGIDPQKLLGHKDARMTAVYLDSRGREWVVVD